MHGCSLVSACLIDAEFYSMGELVDDGPGISLKTSPRQVAIVNTEVELRQEYDDREERKRELEFLQKGGNPLDFKHGNVASLTVLSTSSTDQHSKQIVARNFGRYRGPTLYESNISGNLPLFDGEDELIELEGSCVCPRRSNAAQLEQCSQINRSRNVQLSEDSAIFRPYARRNRSRSNREGPHSSSTGMFQSHFAHRSFSACGGLRDEKVLACERNDVKDQNKTLASTLRSSGSNGDFVLKTSPTKNQLDVVVNGAEARGLMCSDIKGGLTDGKLNATSLSILRNDKIDQGGLSDRKLNTTSSSALRNDKLGQPFDSEVQQPSAVLLPRETTPAGGAEHMVLAASELIPCAPTGEVEGSSGSGQLTGFSSEGDQISISNRVQNGSTAFSFKRLDLEFCSSSQTSVDLDVNNSSDLCTDPKNFNTNGNTVEPTLQPEGALCLDSVLKAKEENENSSVDGVSIINFVHTSVCQEHNGDGSIANVGEEKDESRSCSQDEGKYPSNSGGVKEKGFPVTENDRKTGNFLGNNMGSTSEACSAEPQESVDISISDIPETSLSGRKSPAPDNHQASGTSNVKRADDSCEDSILEEARIIEAKHKRIAELSIGTMPVESQQKFHWDFVLEEMAWLSNDFAQERLWKITAASQLSQRVAFAYWSRFEEQNQLRKLKRVAYTLAKSVMQFWQTAEIHQNEEDKELGQGYQRKCSVLPVLGYAVRFLKYSSSYILPFQAEAPVASGMMSDCISGMLWEDPLTKESLFYTVSLGATESYRNLIESFVEKFEKVGRSMLEEVETCIYDAGAVDAYGEDEGEKYTYCFPGTTEYCKSTKFARKKRKNSLKLYDARSCEMGGEMPFGICTNGTQLSMLIGKRPPSGLHVSSIPTKRMRTASRQRIISPYGVVANRIVQVQAKTDVSSGDTSSLHNDQNSLNDGHQIQRSVEVESGRNFEKPLPHDSAETSRPKKQKKSKHMHSMFNHGRELDSTAPNELLEQSRKRLDSYHVESKGTRGLYEHHVKKLKIMKQSIDYNLASVAPISRSIPSPVASEMSNMSNPNEVLKFVGAHDRGRQSNDLKVFVEPLDASGSWSQLEDQALIVFVHDMGPNWEFVSDAINSAFHPKCIHRKPQECMDRHRILMDRSSSGADSAEDSGSSPCYPSTLPGIPKGSARQLFQRLQGPVEENTMKSHFEKIILIGHRLYHQRRQNDKQERKKIARAHDSHFMALSQVCPNNLNGGILMPLDLCDATMSSTEELPLGHQGSQSSGLSLPNRGGMDSVFPNSGANGMVLGSNTSSLSGSVRYGVLRLSPSLADQQQQTRQYNQLSSGGDIQKSSLSTSGAISGTNRGVHMLPGGNGMGIMGGMNRRLATPRPGFQGMPPSTILDSGSMVSTGMAGMPSSVNMHSGAGPVQGTSMHLQRVQPGHNSKFQRQMMVPELLQVAPGNCQEISPFSGLSSGFPNQITPIRASSGHPQQHQISRLHSHTFSNHHPPHLQGSNCQPGSQQQPNAICFAKERQLQKGYLQQQQLFSTSSALMPHVQLQPQQLIPSSIQNSFQVQSQTASKPVSLPSQASSSPMSPVPSQHLSSYRLGQNPQAGVSSLNNQMRKQEQRQLQQRFQESGRNHPQPGQHSKPEQHPKLLDGFGKGNMLVQQNVGVDPSQLSGTSMAPGNQSPDKGDQTMHLMNGQGLYSNSNINSVQPSKPYIPLQSLNEMQMGQNLCPGSMLPSMKQIQLTQSRSDSSIQNQSPAVQPGNTYFASHHSGPAITGSNHRRHPQQKLQAHPQQKQVSQTQPTVERILEQNHEVNSNPSKTLCQLSQSNQQSLNKVLEGGSAVAISQACIEPPNTVPTSSSGITSQPIYATGMPTSATQVGSTEGSLTA